MSAADQVSSTARPDLDRSIAISREHLAAGRRGEAVAEARRAVAQFPLTARSHRLLSDSLTYEDLFRYEVQLSARLVAEGAIAEALKCSRTAMRLPDTRFEDPLQAGYCLTALGRYREATDLIRFATDSQTLAESPGLFSGLEDNWKALHPAFLIVGVMKGGTTSLLHYLSKHPRILPPIVKEMHYFGSPERGVDWYLAHFPRRPQWERRFVTGEAYVGNFASRKSAEVASSVFPDARIIVVLRDPVARVLSHYYHELRVGIEKRSIDDAIDEELEFFRTSDGEPAGSLWRYFETQRSYLYLGLYLRQISKWLHHFPRNNLLVVISEELNAAPEVELPKVFKHIGLTYKPLGEYANKFPGVYDDQPKDRVKAKLEAFFREPNAQLFMFLGRKLNWQGVAED